MSVKFHRQLGEDVVTKCGADRLIACGDFAADVVFAAREAGMPSARATACRVVEETIPLAKFASRPGSAVLVKGSRADGIRSCRGGHSSCRPKWLDVNDRGVSQR